MRKYLTRTELESLLLAVINLPGSTIKEIATTTGIKANTLYKWKTTPVHLSPEKADKLLLYSWNMSRTDWNWQNWFYHKNTRNPDASIQMQLGFPFIYINNYIIITLGFLCFMGSIERRRILMANYKGLNCIMGEITTMVL